MVEIVSALPGWYARWRFLPELTHSYPVAVWALVEDTDTGNRQVVGVDSSGRWPGGTATEPGADFVRYVFQSVDTGQPNDLVNPLDSASEGAI
jgi:hypothetical protein